ncbi:MAG: hypothetical protein ACRENF_00255, partial [Thermodesulfobacteriota bacterium]
VYALREASSREKSTVMDILQDNGFKKEEADFIVDIVEKYKGVQQTKAAARDFAHKATNFISSLPQNEFKKSLTLLADHVVERRK